MIGPDPLLKEKNAEAEEDFSLSNFPHESGAVPPIVPRARKSTSRQQLLRATPNEVPILRDALVPHKDELLDRLWAVAESPGKVEGSATAQGRAARRWRSTIRRKRWAKAGGLVVNDLVLENPVFLGQWSESFRPVKNRILPRLSEIFRDHSRKNGGTQLATNILADYAADQPQVLADLLMDADESSSPSSFQS